MILEIRRCEINAWLSFSTKIPSQIIIWEFKSTDAPIISTKISPQLTMTTTNRSVVGSGPIWAPANAEDKLSGSILLEETWGKN